MCKQLIWQPLAKYCGTTIAFRTKIEKHLITLGSQLTLVWYDRDDFIRVNHKKGQAFTLIYSSCELQKSMLKS